MPVTESSLVDNILKHNLINKYVFTYYIPNGKEGKASFGVIVDELKDRLSDEDITHG